MQRNIFSGYVTEMLKSTGKDPHTLLAESFAVMSGLVAKPDGTRDTFLRRSL
jgi:hypothetical protein